MTWSSFLSLKDPSVPNKVVLELSTEDGLGCSFTVNKHVGEPDNGDNHKEAYNWKACYLGGTYFDPVDPQNESRVADFLDLILINSSSAGVNYFTDPDIGDFSIEFSKAGGKNGNTVDGLHDPIVKINNVANGDPIDIQAIYNFYPSGTSSGMICTTDARGQGTLS